jgi:hypothetical protein
VSRVSEPLLAMTRALAQALEAAEIGYMLIGAMARTAWGRPRSTKDVDLVVTADQASWEKLLQTFSGLGLSPKQQTPPGEIPPDTAFFFTPDKVRVDVLVAKTPFEHSAFSRRARVDFEGTPVWVASPEDLIVYKLIAGRPHDLGDIKEVITARIGIGAGLDWGYIRRWAEEWGVSERLALFEEAR